MLFSRQRGRGDQKERLSLFVILPMLGLLTFLSLRKYWQYLLQSWETFQSVRVTHLGVGEPCVYSSAHLSVSFPVPLVHALLQWLKWSYLLNLSDHWGVCKKHTWHLVQNGNSLLVTAHSLVREDCLCHRLLERILLTPSSWGCTSVMSYGLLCQLWGHRDLLIVCELLLQGSHALHNSL